MEIPNNKVFKAKDYLRSQSSILIPEGVTELAEEAFYGFDKLENVVLPSTLISIGDRAFENCKRLKTINLKDCPYLEHIGLCAFDSVQISSIDLSKTKVNYIGGNAFAHIDKLTSVILPETLKEIGDFAFSGSAITEIIIPDSVVHIGQLAFNCNLLEKATIGKSAKNYCDLENLRDNAIFYHTPKLKELTFRSEVVEYTGATKLNKVTFDDTVKELGIGAFAGCDELEEVVIPDSVEKIGAGAFMNCHNLSSIVLSDNITEIAEGAFSGTSVREIVFPRELRKLGLMGPNYERLRKLDFSKVTKLRVIPEQFIGDNTPRLKELVLPMGVELIEENICGENFEKLFLPPTVEEVECLYYGGLNIYCFSPKIEELGLMVEDQEDFETIEDANHLYVLPEYLEKYKAQYMAEDIPEKCLTIDVIPEELRYYYDN